MSMVFDQDGNPVISYSDPEPKPNVCGQLETPLVHCPTCGILTVLATDVVTGKKKPRECPNCGTYIGDW